jgi:hypothetical protein
MNRRVAAFCGDFAVLYVEPVDNSVATSRDVVLSSHVANMLRMEPSVIPLVVATSENWTPSRRLQAAALAERERVERKLAELDRNHAELSQRLSMVASMRDDLRDRLLMLNRLVHDAADESLIRHADVNGGSAPAFPQGSGRRSTSASSQTETDAIPPGTTVLRGQAIREAAVRAIASSPRAFEPLHYKDWYELLRGEGVMPAGKVPLATFLTQLGRSPVVTRTSSQGVYMLDHEFPERARRQLEQLRRQLRDSHDDPVGADPAALAVARERRSELLAEVERLERELEEAFRSLSAASSPLRATG